MSNGWIYSIMSGVGGVMGDVREMDAQIGREMSWHPRRIFVGHMYATRAHTLTHMRTQTHTHTNVTSDTNIRTRES